MPREPGLDRGNRVRPHRASIGGILDNVHGQRAAVADESFDEDEESGSDSGSSLSSTASTSTDSEDGNDEGGRDIEYEDDYCIDSDLETTDDDDDSHYKHSRPNRGMFSKYSQYAVVRRVGRELGLREMRETSDWSVLWIDCAVQPDRVAELRSWQVVNHIPRISEICSKDKLARNIARMKRHFPEHFNFVPVTWILPHDWSDMASWLARKNHAGFTPTLILKPAHGAQGTGIELVQRLAAVRDRLDDEPEVRFVCQQYIARPLTVEGFKMDLRMYVLITSVVPFRIYLYDEGLLRFATERYRAPVASNLDAVHQHLTNYHLNRDSDGYVPSGGDGNTGSKRRLTWLWDWLEQERGAKVRPILAEIESIMVKTVLSATETLQHNYRSSVRRWQYRQSSACFQILGFDFMLERDLRPWLIEVNHSPSFTCDTELDTEIKEGAVRGALRLADVFGPDPKVCREQEQRAIDARILSTRDHLSSRVDGKSMKGTTGSPHGSRRAAKRSEDQRRASDEAAARLARIEAIEATELAGDGPRYRRIYPPGDTGTPESSEELAALYQHFLDKAPAVNSATVASKGHSDAAKATIAKLRAAEQDKTGLKGRRQTKSRTAQTQYRSRAEPDKTCSSREGTKLGKSSSSGGILDREMGRPSIDGKPAENDVEYEPAIDNSFCSLSNVPQTQSKLRHGAKINRSNTALYKNVVATPATQDALPAKNSSGVVSIKKEDGSLRSVQEQPNSVTSRFPPQASCDMAGGSLGGIPRRGNPPDEVLEKGRITLSHNRGAIQHSFDARRKTSSATLPLLPASRPGTTLRTAPATSPLWDPLPPVVQNHASNEVHNHSTTGLSQARHRLVVERQLAQELAEPIIEDRMQSETHSRSQTKTAAALAAVLATRQNR